MELEIERRMKKFLSSMLEEQRNEKPSEKVQVKHSEEQSQSEQSPVKHSEEQSEKSQEKSQEKQKQIKPSEQQKGGNEIETLERFENDNILEKKAIDMNDLFDNVVVMDNDVLDGGVDMSAMMNGIVIGKPTEIKEMSFRPEGTKNSSGNLSGGSKSEMKNESQNENESDSSESDDELNLSESETESSEDFSFGFNSSVSESDSETEQSENETERFERSESKNDGIEIIKIKDYENLLKEKNSKAVLGGTKPFRSTAKYSDMYPFVLNV